MAFFHHRKEGRVRKILRRSAVVLAIALGGVGIVAVPASAHAKTSTRRSPNRPGHRHQHERIHDVKSHRSNAQRLAALLTRVSWRKRLVAFATLCVAFLGINAVVATPAHAINTSAVSYFEFDKGSNAPMGVLHFWVFDGLTDALILHKQWTAGSGSGSTDECYKDHGWLPNGYYSVKAWHKTSGVILGDIFQLSDKACPSGTVRTLLFIHTEQTASNTQCADASGDQSCRWEGSSDYYSDGCIKLSPTDLHSAYAAFTGYNKVDTWYANKLYVHD
jgi:hypothetical protein